MALSIAHHHRGCAASFRRLCDVARARHHSSQAEFQEGFDKYSLWVGNVGAEYSGKSSRLSLDYRLREASLYRDEVCKISDKRPAPSFLGQVTDDASI